MDMKIGSNLDISSVLSKISSAKIPPAILNFPTY